MAVSEKDFSLFLFQTFFLYFYFLFNKSVIFLKIPTYTWMTANAFLKTANEQKLFTQQMKRISKSMKKVNKQCLLDTPLTVSVSEKTWQVKVQTSRP